MGTPPDREGQDESWQPSGWQSEWQQPVAEQPAWQQPEPARTSGKSTAALVLGILGLVFCPLICSVLALVFGYRARTEIDASGGRVSGRGNATAGIVLGWAGIAIMFALLVLFGLGLTVGGDPDLGTPGEPSSLS